MILLLVINISAKYKIINFNSADLDQLKCMNFLFLISLDFVSYTELNSSVLICYNLSWLKTILCY